ncbi:hypothetical protein EWM64_g3732 [Hericium alpestre]|uniref:E3 ubiquitin-protein ligase CCNB1IP1 n=1 Tax=Hericium alpestre TaxID=135208 RepID=A0A4Z0A1U5_9AGAM|nr:hypothetical protein EWM64_g3732 [Hericium alpestre]
MYVLMEDRQVCSLHPSNDYKTSVLSGLNPSTILEICSRAISFWQYQIHQEYSFQQAVLRNINDKNAQLQKQLDNVIREANGEISLLGNKITELEHDLELERRKVRDLQEGSREREKEYQKLKVQHDKIKRKALLQPDPIGNAGFAFNPSANMDRMHADEHASRNRATFGGNCTNNVDIGAVVGGMEANGRTPIVNRTGASFVPQAQNWNQAQERNAPQRQHFSAGDRSFRTNTISERSDSAQEVENLLGSSSRPHRRTSASHHQAAWSGNHANKPNQRIFAPTSRRASGGFKPAGMGPR